MAGGNRERILQASIELFNRSGAGATSTNHIAAHLKISPGNLYFHFRNKEDIVREIFALHCAATYDAWDFKRELAPRDFLAAAFEVSWTYRFFHREMHHLRRQDPRLSRDWKRHLKKCFTLLERNYRGWVAGGKMVPIGDPWEMKALSESVMLVASGFLGFYESVERPASRAAVRSGIRHAERLLAPYLVAD